MSMLDGYLPPIIIGPRSIRLDERFVDLLGDRCRFEVAAGKTFVAIASRINAITEGLSIAPEKHGPIFKPNDDRMVLPQPWCTRSLTSMRLR
jgi:hypothetical protein